MGIKTFLDKIGITHLINKINSLFVHKTNDEEINGIKTFKNNLFTSNSMTVTII